MAAGGTGAAGATGPRGAQQVMPIYSAEDLHKDGKTLNVQPADTLMEIVSDVISAIMFMRCFT